MVDTKELVTAPSINKTASIATHGRSWGEVGATGQKSYTLQAHITKGRSYNPELSLSYDGSNGNGPYGLGWASSQAAITRKISKGVPRYRADDVMQADGTDLRPELDADGNVLTRPHRHRAIDYQVVRYIPRVETDFSRYELWTPEDGKPPFWMVFRPDGSQYCYGNSSASCIQDPDQPMRIAVWLLVEMRNSLGENIVYKYRADDGDPDPLFDYRAQRYLSEICYCNKDASSELFSLLHEDPATAVEWLLRVVLDYGERSDDADVAPTYQPPAGSDWPVRDDPSRKHRFGFEVGTRRLCRQVLMFNHVETTKVPVLTHRLLLEYQSTALRYKQLTAAHYFSYGPKGEVETYPPIEFGYTEFELDPTPQRFPGLDRMPGLNEGQQYFCLDLYGEGLCGILCKYDNAWYYREPLRGEPGTQEIVYSPWSLLPQIPNADTSKAGIQMLTDLTGDGGMQWVFVTHGIAGYYKLNPDRSWSPFQPLPKVPSEFLHEASQLADIAGDGLHAVTLVSPNNVRVYPNLRQNGFAQGVDVAHETDRLPVFGNSRSRMTTFNDLSASDAAGLCRVSHDGVECWSSLGHGKFTQGRKISALPFDYATFDTGRIRIADLDGSGAAALIHLCPDWFEIYFNHGGNGLQQEPVKVPWPSGIRYDNLCQVTFADLQGLGCASLLLTVPHMEPQHWVYHFVSQRPYMLEVCNNNMGYHATLSHRSSAQYWLDEKQQLLDAGKPPVCHLPFPHQVLSRLRQDDEVTGNQLVQLFRYYNAYYDSREREFRGFGRVYQTDSELTPGLAESGHTAPLLVKKWFHTGATVDQQLQDISSSDKDYQALGATLYPPSANEAEVVYALSGRTLRVETLQADSGLDRLFTLSEVRYRVAEPHAGQSSLIVLEQETRNYQYECFMDDPLCQHVVHLDWDRFFHLTHSMTIACARRRSESDDPPFEEQSQQQAWRDSFDPQQKTYFVTESRAELIHMDRAPRWLLGLPWRQRSNVLMLPEGILPLGLTERQISVENIALHQDSSAWNELRELTSQSEQHYLQADTGEISYPPLLASREQAVFNETALAAYDEVPDFDIRLELENIGYKLMDNFFPSDRESSEPLELWSAESDHLTYAEAAGFHRVTSVQETLSHGVTEITADSHHLHTSTITLADGCQTRIEYDYHHLLPWKIVDANNNVQEVKLRPDGEPAATSFYGTEDGVRQGFRPLEEYPTPPDSTPGYAIENSAEYLAAAATARAYDLFSWMPQILLNTALAEHQQWIARGLVQPDGRVRASVVRRLQQLKNPDPVEQRLLTQLSNAAREPVHAAVLRADRYGNDPERQILIEIMHMDGWGRNLQTKQQVPKGLAFVLSDTGDLELENGVPREALADPRWRVSERKEYNQKGEPIRIFRPYFMNRPEPVNDSSMREHGHCDQLFYDATGKQIKMINAKGYLAFTVVHPWLRMAYDFNDTDDSPPKKPARRPGR